MPVQTFPHISDENIITFFVDHSGKDDVPVTPATLKSPTPESVMAAFSFFMKEIMGFNLDAAIELLFGQQTIPFYEVYQERIPFLRFFGCMREFLLKCHYNTFSITDLTQPRSKKFRRQLAALVNFALFSERINDEFADEVVQKCVKDQELVESLTQENAELKAKTQDDLLKIADCKALIDQEESGEAQRQKELTQLKEDGEDMTKQVRALKADIARMKDGIQTDTVKEAQVMEEMKSLENKLVDCPDQVREALQNAEFKLRESEMKREELVSKQRALVLMVQNNNKLLTDCDKYSQKINDVLDQMKQLQEQQNKISNIGNDIDTARKNVEHLDDIIRSLENKVKMREDGVESDLMEKHQIELAIEQEVEQRSRILSELSDALSRDRRHVDNISRQLEQTTLDCDSKCDTLANELNDICQRQDQIRNRTDTINDEYDEQLAKMVTILRSLV